MAANDPYVGATPKAYQRADALPAQRLRPDYHPTSEKHWFWIYLISTLFISLLSSIEKTHYFGDGAYFYLQIFIRNGFYLFDEPRILSQIYQQIPLMIWASATPLDINSASTLYGISLNAVWPTWSILTLIATKSYPKALFILAFGTLIGLPSRFFPASEINIWAATTLTLITVIESGRRTPSAWLVLFISSILLTRCYEIALASNIPIAILAIKKARGKPTIFEAALVSTLLAGALLSAYFYLNNPNPNEKWLRTHLIYTLPIFGLCIVALKSNLSRKSILIFSLTPLALGITDIFIFNSYYFGKIQYPGRSLIIWGVFATEAITLVAAHKTWAARIPRAVLPIGLVLLHTLSIGFIINWSAYKNEFSKFLKAENGIVSCESILYCKYDEHRQISVGKKLSWNWTFPALSLLLAEKAVTTVVTNGQGAPFDPINTNNCETLAKNSPFPIEINNCHTTKNSTENTQPVLNPKWVLSLTESPFKQND